jgi:F-type H+-transporting ATPase subunit b
MTHLTKARRVLIILTAITTVAVCATFAVKLRAQSEPSQAAEENREPRHAETPGQQLAEASNEAAGEEKDAQFKQSPSVRWVAKHTGLSLRGAFWLSVLVNFGVIAAAIFWLSKKNLPGVFRNRTISIQKAMEEARKASADAGRRLSEIEARLSRLDVEIGEMRMAAEREAAAEEERIKAAAAEDARKIVESAEQEIAAAAKAARRELTAYAADLAVTLARKQIRVDVAIDQQLVSGFAEQLGQNPNGSGPGSKDGH